jgi:hypothetical protein
MSEATISSFRPCALLYVSTCSLFQQPSANLVSLQMRKYRPENWNHACIRIAGPSAAMRRRGVRCRLRAVAADRCSGPPPARRTGRQTGQSDVTGCSLAGHGSALGRAGDMVGWRKIGIVTLSPQRPSSESDCRPTQTLWWPASLGADLTEGHFHASPLVRVTARNSGTTEHA